MKKEYRVSRLFKPGSIDGNWNKPQWDRAETIEIGNYMGKIPVFTPRVQARMKYDNENLYVIFRVNDRYVRCITDEINGPVWEDSCVEFFFAPDTSLPGRYFNLEVNCGGTPLMHYNIIPRKEALSLAPEDIRMIEIAHSMPKIVEPEVDSSVMWSIEYRIPLELLIRYCDITRPGPGIKWMGNFYKISENSSNPHYITWSEVINPVPDFHLPQFFGVLNFQ